MASAAQLCTISLCLSVVLGLVGRIEDLRGTDAFSVQAIAGSGPPPVDPKAARKAEEEAEERRLAEIRSHGTMVTPQTFAEWKQRFEIEMALQRGTLQGSRPASSCFVMKAYSRRQNCLRCLWVGKTLHRDLHKGPVLSAQGMPALIIGMTAQALTATRGRRRIRVQQGSISSAKWRLTPLQRYTIQ